MDPLEALIALRGKGRGSAPADASQVGLAGTALTQRENVSNILDLGRSVVNQILPPPQLPPTQAQQAGMSLPEKLAWVMSYPGLAPTVYHGTPNWPFENFDLSKVGWGENTQGQGSGIYHTASEAAAQWYARNLSQQPRWITLGSEKVPYGTPEFEDLQYYGAQAGLPQSQHLLDPSLPEALPQLSKNQSLVAQIRAGRVPISSTTHPSPNLAEIANEAPDLVAWNALTDRNWDRSAAAQHIETQAQEMDAALQIPDEKWRNQLRAGLDLDAMRQSWANTRDRLRAAIPLTQTMAGPNQQRAVLSVDLPDAQVPRLADWDTPGRAIPAVKAAIENFPIRSGPRISDFEDLAHPHLPYSEAYNEMVNAVAAHLENSNMPLEPQGRRVAAAKVSNFMASHGVPGHAYMSGHGNQNYVIYDPSILKILNARIVGGKR